VINVLVQLAAAGGADPRRVEDELRPFELALEPLHPGADDRSLASWFRVVVDDTETADRVAAALRESPAVESAYVEPPSGPPG
jgi:hypothetical protein